MTAVGFQDAARYAVKLFGYLLAVVVVATGAISIGYWLVRPEISPALGQGTTEKAPLVGGSVLILVGSAILSIGTISAVYKLLADAVQAGGPAPTAAVAAEPAAQPTEEREPTPVQAGAEAETERAEAGRTDAAVAASERARAAQAEADQSPDETTSPAGTEQPDSSAALGKVDTADADTAGNEGRTIGSQAGRETSPVPSESETSRDPTDRETAPEPPKASGEDADRPEPSAEEIAFGSGKEADSGSEEARGGPSEDVGGGAADEGQQTEDGETMFTSKSVSGAEEEGDDSLDPMWSDEGTEEGDGERSGDEGDDDGAGPTAATGFEEPPIDEDVEPAGTADRDPLADDE